MQIAGKVAVVTGGASGIGRATAQRLVNEGARVVIADVREALATQVAEAIGASAVRLDVGDPADWEGVLDKVVESHGGLDIVHLNAGTLTRDPGIADGFIAQHDITMMTDDQYRAVTRVNIDGVVFGVRAAAKRMRAGGCVVATASIAGVVPFGGDPIYCMTKHAVVGLVRSLGPAFKERGIQINAVCPGIVRTAIASEESFKTVSERGVQVMEPSQIADAVVQVITSADHGKCFVCLPGQPPSKPAFPRLDINGAGAA